MTRLEREIAKWVKRGTKLSQREPDAFRAAIRNAEWNIVSTRALPPIDTQQLPIDGVELPPKKKKDDNGRRATEYRPWCSGRVVAAGAESFVVMAVEHGETRVVVHGDTKPICESLPFVMVHCVATVPTNGASNKARLEYRHPGDLIVCRDEQELAQHSAQHRGAIQPAKDKRSAITVPKTRARRG